MGKALALLVCGLIMGHASCFAYGSGCRVAVHAYDACSGLAACSSRRAISSSVTTLRASLTPVSDVMNKLFVVVTDVSLGPSIEEFRGESTDCHNRTRWRRPS
jgi:hypothetical protein